MLGMIGIMIIGCGFIADKKEENDMDDATDTKQIQQTTPGVKKQQQAIDAYTDTYTITPNSTLPKFKELTAQFAAQKHRFEIDSCVFTYNGQSFFIGDNVEKITNIFGEPESDIIESLDKTVMTYNYPSLGLKFRFLTKNKSLNYFGLTIRSILDKYRHSVPFDIVIFYKIPYQYEMKLNDFLKLSDLNHDKLRHNDVSFIIRRKECAPDENHRITNYILSDPVYQTTDVGIGYVRGNFNPNSSNVINGFGVTLETIDDIKK